VPFTAAHAAAALPFRKLQLPLSALLIGTLAPDFEYFLRMAPSGGFGHTVGGVLLFALPIALLALWIFHTAVKQALFEISPNALQRRLTRYMGDFSFGGAQRTVTILIAILLGIATHLAWDSLTHPNTWPYDHWVFLRTMVQFPVVGGVGWYKILQHGSTVIGLSLVGCWVVSWYRYAEAPCAAPSPRFSRKHRWTIFAATLAIAGLAAGLRIIVSDRAGFKVIVGEWITAMIAFVWWQLVILGLYWKRPAMNAS